MPWDKRAAWRSLSIFIAAWLSACAPAHSPVSGASESTIGYASIDEALEALHAKSHAGEDVVFSTENGWTIVEERAEHTIWSFTPADHPAHPAVVKRALEEEDGAVWIRTTAMCGAEKAACDEMVKQFEQLNKRAAADSGPQHRAASEGWAPSDRQKESAEATAFEFLRAKDQGRFEEAYALFALEMQSSMPIEKFVLREERFRGDAGGDPERNNTRVTWYKDPPNAFASGVFAAFDLTCRYPKIRKCAEVVILHEQDDGSFLVLRYEQTVFNE